MKVYHMSDTLHLGQTLSPDYNKHMELLLPFLQALERSEDCFYAMLYNAKYLKTVLGHFQLRDMWTNYVKWATEAIFEYVRRTEFPESCSRITGNYFYDNLPDCKRLYEVDWGNASEKDRQKIRLFEIDLQDDFPNKRDMLLYDEAFDAMWDNDDLPTAIDCARRYFSGGRSASPIWELLSDKPATATADLTHCLR